MASQEACTSSLLDCFRINQTVTDVPWVYKQICYRAYEHLLRILSQQRPLLLALFTWILGLLSTWEREGRPPLPDGMLGSVPYSIGLIDTKASTVVVDSLSQTWKSRPTTTSSPREGLRRANGQSERICERMPRMSSKSIPYQIC